MRGQRVILDADLARIYGVQTFRFNEAVKRNQARFPEDFRFQLSKEEAEALTSQTAIPKILRVAGAAELSLSLASVASDPQPETRHSGFAAYLKPQSRGLSFLP